MPTTSTTPSWDGRERRLAGDYPGRIALVTHDQQHQAATSLVLRSWPHNRGFAMRFRPLDIAACTRAQCAAALPGWPLVSFTIAAPGAAQTAPEPYRPRARTTCG